MNVAANDVSGLRIEKTPTIILYPMGNPRKVRFVDL